MCYLLYSGLKQDGTDARRSLLSESNVYIVHTALHSAFIFMNLLINDQAVHTLMHQKAFTAPHYMLGFTNEADRKI